MKNRTKLLSLLIAMSLVAMGCSHIGAADKEPASYGYSNEESVDNSTSDKESANNGASDEESVENDTSDNKSADNEVKESPLDSKLSKVAWHDSEDWADDATIEFTFTDGITKKFDICPPSYVESMNQKDMDNDGEEEYVFHIIFSNTLGEHTLLYVYKVHPDIYENKVEQLFPGNTGITEVDENAFYEEETTVEVDGKSKNAIKVECAVKEDGMGKETYNGIIYYDNGQWKEYNK
ncbi:hypothetical protein D6856_05765 [Butyrivibrio sp. XB500-5]|uniref:hypothetical protein n=1 Tax=Butyrivibrio sp. XB500-5 TaxID=2364880 RepID=UPI000EAA8E1A|nr:hypothetical protein [Butyrivibrio sp. XB500-5]RKM61707.1 hypothetical protein D6856_05765 [Butyrivibrio sp. XB500-5]